MGFNVRAGLGLGVGLDDKVGVGLGVGFIIVAGVGPGVGFNVGFSVIGFGTNDMISSANSARFHIAS